MADLSQININITDTIPPENFATVDKNALVGSVYTKAQDNEWRKEVEKKVISGIKGVLKPNTPYDAVTNPYPTPWVIGNPPLYEKYDVNQAGSFPNTKDSNDENIIVTQNELNLNEVQIWVKNGVSELVKKELPKANKNIPQFADFNFPASNTSTEKIQVIYDNVIYQLKDGETVTQIDIPVNSSKWHIINDYKQDVNAVKVEAESAKAQAVQANINATAAIAAANDAAAQILLSAGVVRFATQAQLLASAVAVVNTDAYAFDTGAWYRSNGTSWIYVGGGALTESRVGIKYAIFDPNRTPIQNATYLNGLLNGGSVHVQVVGRGIWLVDRSIRIWDNSILDLGFSTLKFSQVPVMDGNSGANAVVSNRTLTPYQVNSGIAVGRNITLRNGTLDAGGFGQAGTSSRYNGYTFVGLENFLIENITCQNGSGYLQWLPGCSYGTVRNTTSINGEENFELAEHAHHILIQGLRCKDAAVNGILLYQGVHDIIISDCRIEGSGNGINIAPIYGDCYNINVDAQVRVSGVALLAGGSKESSYLPLSPGFTQDPVTKTIKNTQGAIVYVADQRINVNGSYQSTTVNPVQTGTDGDAPKGMAISGDYGGITYGIQTLGNENSPILKIRNASITIDCSQSGSLFPAALNNTTPLDIDGLNVTMFGAELNKRNIGNIGSKDIVRRLREVGERCTLNVFGGILDSCEISYVTTFGSNKKIIRGGKLYNLETDANETNLTLYDCIIENRYKSWGNSSGVRLSRLIVMPSATFEAQSKNIVEACDVNGVFQNQNNGYIDYSNAPDGTVPTVFGGKIIFLNPNSIWKPSGPNNLSDCALWLRAEDFTLSDGDSVASWIDKSGKSKNAVQTTSSAQPVFKTGIINNKPVVRFDGINDTLKTAALDYAGSNKATVFIVAKLDSSDVSGHIINSSVDTINLYGGFVVYRDTYNSLIGGSPESSVYTYEGTDVCLLVARIDYTQLNTLERWRLRINGIQNNQIAYNNNANEPLVNHPFNIGNPSNPLKVDIAEIMVIKREMLDSEILEAEGLYFKPKYAIAF